MGGKACASQPIGLGLATCPRVGLAGWLVTKPIFCAWHGQWKWDQGLPLSNETCNVRVLLQDLRGFAMM